MKIEQSLKKYFSGQKDILCVYLFGSQAKGTDNKGSDVDIGVLFDQRLSAREYTEKRLSLMDSLSSLLDKDVDVIVLNQAAPFLKFQIIKQGRRIYERPDRNEHSFEARAIVEYLDFLPVRQRLEEALLNNINKA